MAASIEYKLDPSLAEADPELYDLLEHERARQFKGLGAFCPQIHSFPKILDWSLLMHPNRMPDCRERPVNRT
jgi:hypothetical protein